MKRALVLSLIFAVAIGMMAFGQTLGGKWYTKITVDMTGALGWPDDITIASEVVVDYTVGDWTFSSETDLLNGVWTNQDFDFAGVLGAFTISGDIEFYPSGPFPYTGLPQFQRMDFEVGVSIAGVTFGASFDLVPGAVDLILSGSGVAGDVTIEVDIKFGDETLVGCDFDFTYVDIYVDFPFCCALVSANLFLTCDGFEYVTFCVEDITITNLPWLTLGACITFQTDSKTFAWYPSIDLGVIGCDFDLYYRLLTDPPMSGSEEFWGESPINGSWILDGIIFDGIQIACEIGGVSFTGISYWGPGSYFYGYGGYGYYLPGILYGWEGYGFWEAYQIATTDDGCCGPFGFDVTVFFGDESSSLFDVSYIVAEMSLQIATQFTFGMGIETDIDADTVNDVWFSFLVEW